MSNNTNRKIIADKNSLDGWTISSLGEISEKPQYGWTTKANHEKGKLKLLRTTDITSGTLDWSTVPYCTEEPEDIEKYLVKSGDILISRAGSIGVSFLVTNPERAVFASYLIRFRPKRSMDEKYVYYYLKSPDYWTAIGASKVGIAVPNVNATKLSQVHIPLAPLNEQKLIVAEIEKQFSRLDEAVAALKRIQANLKRYKASVLKAAVEGNLTEKWRRKNPDVEPASKLLNRILAERKRKWEAVYPAKKYKEPTLPDISGLPELPKGWVWGTLEQVAERITKGSSPNWQGFNYVEKGIPFVRSQNVLWGELDTTNIAHLPKEFNKKEAKSILQIGDVLLNIVGASIGRPAIATREVEGGNVNQAVAVIRLIKNGLNNIFLMNYLISADTQGKINKEKVDVARANLSLGDISELIIPLPPVREQQAIINEIEQRLSVAEESESAVEINLKRAERLRQSILKKAFSGKLGSAIPK